MAAGKDLAARRFLGGIIGVAADGFQPTGLSERIDYPANSLPVDCAGTHGAKLGAGIESAIGEFGLR